MRGGFGWPPGAAQQLELVAEGQRFSASRPDF